MIAKNHETAKPVAAVGRPRIVLTRDQAIRALYLLSLRFSYDKVAKDVGVKRQWLADAYHDKRLHQMAGQRAGGEILRPFSIFGNLVENSPEGGEW